jgi:hypothetical protein
MANVIVCPKCKKGLRVNGPVPAGKKVTCPACQSPFVTGGSEAPSTAKQAKKPAPVVAKTSPNPPANAGFSTKPQAKKAVQRVDVVEEVEETDEVEEVRPRGRRVHEDDDDDRPRRRRDVDDDDADDEDDDRGSRRKRKKRKSGSNLGLILGLSGVGVLLLALVITGFVWPGFFLSGRGGGGVAGGPPGAPIPGGGPLVAGAPAEPNPLAFLPGDSNLVAGINVAQLRTVPQFQALWNSLQDPGQPFGNMPPDVRSVVNTTDRFLVAANVDREELPIVVLVTSQPYDPEKLKPHLGPPTSVQGQTIYPDKGANAKQTFIGMPSSKILLVSQLPAEQFGALMARANAVQLHPDLQQQVGSVRNSLYWASLRFDEVMKQKMVFVQDPGPGAPPEFKNIMAIVQRGKGVNVTVDVENQKMKLNVGMNCNDANDAAQLRNSVQNLWNGEGKKMVDALRAVGGAQLNPLINEVTQTLAFDQRDTTAAMTVQINLNTLQQMANAGNNPGFNLPFGPGGFNPPLPPGFKTKKKGPPIGPPGFKKKF